MNFESSKAVPLSVAPDPNLVAYWAFDEGTDAITYDYSGNNEKRENPALKCGETRVRF